MRFDQAFLDDLKARVAPADVIGRRVKLQRRGRNLIGLCPFHNEKTPSFHVFDDHYHCFGCGAHGSAIDFVMGTEGLSFPEAVEQLAGEAGLPLPEITPQEAAAARRRATLYDVMTSAARWYTAQLSGQGGGPARDYLAGRGLKPETVERFGLGYAPRGRTALKEALQARDIPEAQLVEAGLLIQPEDGGASYDRFRDRIMFPITDARGRTIAFGGRAMSPDARAKYLNSPETPLFHKGRQLYNIAAARKPAFDAGTVVVVEGYMDVIALAEAGLDHAVAPLGTAVTEEQLALLWRMAPEPVLCFDGDAAGLRAAAGAAGRALPLLKPGFSLRFALMPEGEDPDSLVRKEGVQTVRALFDQGQSLADLLWSVLTAKTDLSTPERRAGLEKTVFGRLSAITDEKVRGFYQRDFRDRLFALFANTRRGGPARQGRRGDGGAWRRPAGGRQVSSQASPQASPSGRLARTALGRGRRSAAATARYEQLVMLTVLNHPALLVTHLEDLAGVDLADQELDKLRAEILRKAAGSHGLEREALRNHLLTYGLEGVVKRLERHEALKDDWFAWPEAALNDAELGFLHILDRLRKRALEKDVAAAETDYRDNPSEANWQRLRAMRTAYLEAGGDEAGIDGYGLASGRLSSF